jgi:hypothetical protein
MKKLERRFFFLSRASSVALLEMMETSSGRISWAMELC